MYWLLHLNLNESGSNNNYVVRLSTLARARSKSNAAILSVLQREADNTTNPNRNDNNVEEEEVNYYRLGLRQYKRYKSSSTCSTEGNSLHHTCSQQGSVTAQLHHYHH